jgi:hypothetical protein
MNKIIGKVIIHGTEELAKFIAALVREGIIFDSYPQSHNDMDITSYIVEFNGGC